MRNKDCPVKTTGHIGGCGNQCGYYDEHAQQCSQVSQAMALRDIAEQLKRNADAMMDYSPEKDTVEVELQPVKICGTCKHFNRAMNDYPCQECKKHSKWEPK